MLASCKTCEQVDTMTEWAIKLMPKRERALRFYFLEKKMQLNKQFDVQDWYEYEN